MHIGQLIDDNLSKLDGAAAGIKTFICSLSIIAFGLELQLASILTKTKETFYISS